MPGGEIVEALSGNDGINEETLGSKNITPTTTTVLYQLEMLDINGATVSYEDVVKGKPTIFCFSSNWMGTRYELDQQATKNSDLRFVFVVEGTNLKQWQQYTERAVPEAEAAIVENDDWLF